MNPCSVVSRQLVRIWKSVFLYVIVVEFFSRMMAVSAQQVSWEPVSRKKYCWGSVLQFA